MTQIGALKRKRGLGGEELEHLKLEIYRDDGAHKCKRSLWNRIW